MLLAHRIARKARLLEEIHRKRFPENEMSFHVLVPTSAIEWPDKIPDIPAEMVNERQLLIVFNRLRRKSTQTSSIRWMDWKYDEIHMHGGLKLKGDP